ncbi:hypothetical protein G210_3359 [Candida maltosa Xu316]|uniref:Uncharacterized protein n=1 Tax=Candida maltosa (strain Xu316) TaxID=1245528 RepID=M3HGJ5_CANMX|nr:hypothetical protein G210_3359 [Candida maltosa Xu316]
MGNNIWKHFHVGHKIYGGGVFMFKSIMG